MSNGHRQTDGWRRRRTAAAVAVVGLGLATGSVATASTDTTVPTEGTAGGGEVDYQWTPNADLLAAAEDEVNVIAWAAYLEDGSTDPAADWVTPFEDMTGCAVNVTLGNSSDEMVALMQSGEYDGVSASGDATERLIAGGEVGPLDVSQMSSYEQIFDDLKLQQWNSVDGEPYGMPHGRGANLLVFNTEAFADGAPDSWSVMFEGGTPADGAISVYDYPIYIADAALYLMATQPDLGITNPYALDETQFAAAIALLEQQEELVGQYWPVFTDQQTALEGGTVLAGTTWQVTVNYALANGATIDAVKPVEGATGWSDTWMVSARGREPQLHAVADGLDHVAVGQRPGRRVVRRGSVEQRVVRLDSEPRPLLAVPRRRDRVLGGRVVLDDAHRGVPRRAHRRDLRAVCRMGQRLERTPVLVDSVPPRNLGKL